MSQAEVHIKTCGKQEGEEDQDEDEEEIRDDDEKEEINDEEDEEEIRDEDEKEEEEEEEEEEEGEEVYQCGECDLILSDYESMQVCTWVSNSSHILFKSFKTNFGWTFLMGFKH